MNCGQKINEIVWIYILHLQSLGMGNYNEDTPVISVSRPKILLSIRIRKLNHGRPNMHTLLTSWFVCLLDILFESARMWFNTEFSDGPLLFLEVNCYLESHYLLTDFVIKISRNHDVGRGGGLNLGGNRERKGKRVTLLDIGGTVLKPWGRAERRETGNLVRWEVGEPLEYIRDLGGKMLRTQR